MVIEEKFGSLSTRVRDIKDKEVIYIGIESANELYTGLQDV